MKEIDQARVGRVMELADKLRCMAKKHKEDFDPAVTAYKMISECGQENLTAAGALALAKIAIRIHEELPDWDAPEFSIHDCADGVVNARHTVDPEKLARLDPEAFGAAILWLAADKRETYQEQEHMQEPLDTDIYIDQEA